MHFTNHDSGKCPSDEYCIMKLILLYVMKGKFLYLNSYVASLDTFYFFPYGVFPVHPNIAVLVIVM
jgi:hypothetical protein